MAATSDTIELREGEVLPAFPITLKRDGSAVDLTTGTYGTGTTRAFLTAWYKDTDGTVTTLIDGGSCTISDASNGIVTFPFTSTHTANAVEGWWYLETDDTTPTILEKHGVGRFRVLDDRTE